MAFATQWGAKTAVWSQPSKPALRAVPLRGRGEAFAGVDPRLPEVRRDGARRVDDPIGMAEIGGAVGSQLGLVAAQQAVRPRPHAKQLGGNRNADSAAADCGSKCFSKLLVA